MGRLNLRRTLRGGIIAVIVGLAWNLYAGGSGLNTVVVINQNSANSVELGNYYAERRQVPPENVLRVNWTGGNVSWTAAEFQSALLNPLIAALSARQLTNQIDYVVLSMDFPFQTYNGTVINSTTATLFYGLKADSGPGQGTTNSYYASEQIFRQAKPASAPGPSFLAVMLTASSLAQGKALVDQGVNGDATFPNATVFLAKSSDALRNIRYRLFDDAIFNVQLSPANYSMARVNADIPSTSPPLLGLQTGLPYFSLPLNSFVPGAMADSLTSFGGMIIGGDQTTVLEFVRAGASGSYGTVTEPQPVPDKFPNPQNYFYQSRGFTIAECYYQSLRVPYQGLIVAEPLSAPFAMFATGSWSGVISNAVLSGAPLLTANFAAAGTRRPLQQIDLFVDGKFNRTLTNLLPQAGNVVNLTINQRPIGMVVPANATVASLASDLGALINQPANTNATKVAALVRGDRIELHSTSGANLLPPINLRMTNYATGTPTFPTSSNSPPLARTSVGTASALSTFVTSASELFPAASPAFGTRAYTVNGTIQVGTWLQLTVTKTNGALVNIGITNQSISATPFALASNLVAAINTTAALQSADGIVAEDLSLWFSSGGGFNLRARAAGLAAAGIKVQLASSGLALNPGGTNTLMENLADLQPRNHLYVTAGATNLSATFALNTATLGDGYHELTAVAYEGSHVQTQTRVTVPVRIQNIALNATLTLVNLIDPSPVNGTYQIQVTANTNNVSTIKLYSTGGLLGTVNNQSTATFNVIGSSLGIGLHPFYAIVETTAGLRYRTETRRVRLQ